MSWGIVASVGGSLISGAMSSDAAGNAAAAQTASADRATEEQRRQYDQNRADLAPFRDTGVAANQRLAYLMGLTPGNSVPTGGTSVTSGAQPSSQSAPVSYPKQWISSYGGQDVSWQSAPDLTSKSDPSWHPPTYYNPNYNPNDPSTYTGIPMSAFTKPDDVGVATQGQPSAAQVSTAAPSSANDPQFGSLLRKFSASDLEADPVYQSGLQFGLKQGTDAINSRAIAGGSYDSGATLKALTRYANDYGSTKANEAFNRYNIANDSIYNKLAGVSGAGQTATNQSVSSGTAIANNISGLTTDAGNARAAGIIGGANAWGDAASGISRGVNNYNTNQWLKSLTQGKSGAVSPYVNLGTSSGYDSDMFWG